MNCYDIKIDLKQLEAKCLNPDTGEFDLSKYEGDREELILEFGTLIKNKQIEINSLGGEIKKLAEKKQKRQADSDKLLKSLSNFVGIDEKFKDARVSIKYSGSQRVIIDDLEGLKAYPNCFRHKLEPDKKEIKSTIEKLGHIGLLIDNCAHIEHHTELKIS